MKRYFNIGFLNSLILIFVYVLPYLAYAKTDSSYKLLLDFILFSLYVIVAVLLGKDLFNKRYRNAFYFSAFFIIFAIFNQLFNGYFRVYNLIAPLAAYVGFVFVSKKVLNPFPFVLLIIFNYIYFYLIYYAKNPLNFLISESELNVEAFTNTSSNLIPCILIINLYIFDILNAVKFQFRQSRIVLIFALINVFLVLLQRSRAGIVVSILFLFLKLYDSHRRLSYVLICIVALLSLYFMPLIVEYSEAAGKIDLDSYTTDVRKDNIDIFFNSMDSVKDAIFGFGSKFEFMTSAATQNLAITIWNYYTVVPLIIVLLIILVRFFQVNYLSIAYFSVFVFYSAFEGFFLSNYWDFIIYILFFYRINNAILLFKTDLK